MSYTNGELVVLQNGKTIYITEYDSKTDKYRGFNIEETEPKEELVFSSSDIIMKI